MEKLCEVRLRERQKGGKVPYVLNAIEATTQLVLGAIGPTG